MMSLHSRECFVFNLVRAATAAMFLGQLMRNKMAALFNRAFRLRSACRRFSTFKQAIEEEESHALGTLTVWKRISLFIAIPTCLLVTYNAYTKEKEHAKHIEEHGKPEFHPYSHLRIRNKPFPWGDGNHTLIHNPHTNALPEGYEEL